MNESKHKNFERELPSGYKQALHLDARKTLVGIVFNLISFAVLAVVMVLAIVFLDAADKTSEDLIPARLPHNLIALSVFAISMVGYIVLHELVHGVAYKALTGERLTFGMSWSCAFCGVPHIYTYRKAAVISVASPLVIFTLIFIPLLILLFFCSPLYFLIFSFIFGLHLGGCSGDIYVLYLLLLKFRGKKTLMKDTGPEQFFYVLEDVSNSP